MFDLLVSDALRLAHLAAIAVGLGVAVETEIYLTRRRRGTITPGLLSGLEHRHNVIFYALGAMWITGLALIALRTGFRLDAFTPKLWTKLTIVSILSINAHFIAELVLPILAENKGQRLSDLPQTAHRALTAFAGVSATSWLVALVLGGSAVLKSAPALVFQISLPLAYLLGLAIAYSLSKKVFQATRGSQTDADQPANGPRATLPDPQQPANLPAPAHAESKSSARVPVAAHSLPAKPNDPYRASDLAIAFPKRAPRPPRIKPAPKGNAAREAALKQLSEIAGDLGARG